MASPSYAEEYDVGDLLETDFSIDSTYRRDVGLQNETFECVDFLIFFQQILCHSDCIELSSFLLKYREKHKIENI